METADIFGAASEKYTGSSFDVQRFVERSRQLDVSDIDWDAAKSYPVDAGEIRCLTYMMDIEAHTICYLRDVLNADAGADPEIADFLGCWLYEESYHGRAIERFLRAVSVERSAAVCGQHKQNFIERVGNWGTSLASYLPHFLTVYMTWGAIQEHSTLAGYTTLARKTKNPILAEILRRIAREESRHFGFYYYKACQGLKASAFARRMTAFLLRRFWTPVGEGVKPFTDTDFLITYIFEDPEGRQALGKIDATISRLPGLEWFDLMSRRAQAARQRRAKVSLQTSLRSVEASAI